MCGLREYSSMIKVIFSINLGHKMVQISWKSEDLEMKMFAVVWGQFPDGFFCIINCCSLNLRLQQSV